MKITLHSEGDRCTLALHGDLDAASSLAVDEAIAQAVQNGFTAIWINCQELNYISSAGLGVFLSYIQDFNSRQIGLVLFNVSPRIRDVFNLLSLDTLVPILDVGEAATGLARRA